jgi:hypothetical protein
MRLDEVQYQQTWSNGHKRAQIPRKGRDEAIIVWCLPPMYQIFDTVGGHYYEGLDALAAQAILYDLLKEQT